MVAPVKTQVAPVGPVLLGIFAKNRFAKRSAKTGDAALAQTAVLVSMATLEDIAKLTIELDLATGKQTKNSDP